MKNNLFHIGDNVITIPTGSYELNDIIDFINNKLNLTRKNAIVEYLEYYHYSATSGTKGKWRYASSKARLKDLRVMGVRVGVANFFLINR